MGDQRLTGVEAHGSGFRGVYQLAGIRYRTATYPTMKAAFAARGTALEKARNGLHVDPRRTNLTVDGWYALWAPQRPVRACTAYVDGLRWSSHVSPYLGSVKLAALSPFKVQAWLAWMRDNGRSEATAGKAFVLLKTALGPKGAIADRRLAVNPCDGVARPKHQRPGLQLLTRQDFDRILAATPDEWKIVPLLGAFCGLRWSEIAGLRREDFNPLGQTLTIRRGVVRTPGVGDTVNPPKSGKERTVPLHPEVVAALNAVCDGKALGQPLLTAPRGRPINGSHWRKSVWLPALAAAGIDAKEVHFHCLRHSYVSWLLHAGADIGTVMELAGHANLATTQFYVHSSEDLKRSAVLRALG